MAATRHLGGPAAAAIIALGTSCGPAGASELEGCFIGALPCGTPAHLAGLVTRCLADPTACGTLERDTTAPRVRPGRGGSGRTSPVPRGHGPHLAGTRLPAVPEAAPAPQVARRVEAVVRALPVAASLLALEDRLPADVAAVEHALGLRRPVGTVVDLCGAVPSVAALLGALAR